MAILATVKTIHGEERSLYLRVNNTEVGNHGAMSHALVRGFLSEEAFNTGKHYIHEETVEFLADVSRPLWEQVYDQLKLSYSDAVDC
jgi:hypothetical protein